MKEIKADTFTDHFSGRLDQLSVVCVCVSFSGQQLMNKTTFEADFCHGGHDDPT